MDGSIRERRRSSSPTCTKPSPPGKAAARYLARIAGLRACGRNGCDTVAVTPFVSFMNGSITGSPAIITLRQCGSFEAMILPLRSTVFTSSMSSSLAPAAILSSDIGFALPMWRTAVRATCPSMVSMAPATVSCRSITA